MNRDDQQEPEATSPAGENLPAPVVRFRLTAKGVVHELDVHQAAYGRVVSHCGRPMPGSYEEWREAALPETGCRWCIDTRNSRPLPSVVDLVRANPKLAGTLGVTGPGDRGSPAAQSKSEPLLQADLPDPNTERVRCVLCKRWLEPGEGSPIARAAVAASAQAGVDVFPAGSYSHRLVSVCWDV